ncbi:MAG: hypothetical protein ACI9KE_001104 [Polyangiales bacterium]|jgi:hypothetical protein
MGVLDYLGIAVLVVGSLVSVSNYASIWVRWRENRFVSMVPLVGPALSCIGLALHSIPIWPGWYVAVIILDPGTAMVAVALAKYLAGSKN